MPQDLRLVNLADDPRDGRIFGRIAGCAIPCAGAGHTVGKRLLAAFKGVRTGIGGSVGAVVDWGFTVGSGLKTLNDVPWAYDSKSVRLEEGVLGDLENAVRWEDASDHADEGRVMFLVFGPGLKSGSIVKHNLFGIGIGTKYPIHNVLVFNGVWSWEIHDLVLIVLII